MSDDLHERQVRALEAIAASLAVLVKKDRHGRAVARRRPAGPKPPDGPPVDDLSAQRARRALRRAGIR